MLFQRSIWPRNNHRFRKSRVKGPSVPSPSWAKIRSLQSTVFFAAFPSHFLLPYRNSHGYKSATINSTRSDVPYLRYVMISTRKRQIPATLLAGTNVHPTPLRTSMTSRLSVRMRQSIRKDTCPNAVFVQISSSKQISPHRFKWLYKRPLSLQRRSRRSFHCTVYKRCRSQQKRRILCGCGYPGRCEQRHYIQA